MKDRRNKLVAGPKEITAIELDIAGIKAGHHDDTLNNLFQISKLTEMIQQSEDSINMIEDTLNAISDTEDTKHDGYVLRKRYIERIAVEDIAEELHYSSRQSVYDIKNRAIRRFAVNYYGINAVEAM